MINVGDAVLHFIADSTQLDAAFNRVADQAGAKMGVATDAVKGTTTAVGDMTKTMAVGQQGAVELGDTMTLSGKKAAESMYQARGEMGLIDEMLGVHLPRHVVSFVAELPGVGAALSAAFEVTAVLFLLEALVKVGEKLGDFVANTFIYTAAMKESAAAQIALNKLFIEHAAGIDKATKALQNYGETAAFKLQESIQANSAAFSKNTAEMAANESKIAKLSAEGETFGASINAMTGGVLGQIVSFSAWSLGLDENTYKIHSNAEAIQNLKDKDSELLRVNQQLTIELKVLSLELRDQEDNARKQSLGKQEAYNLALISADHAVGRARLDVNKANAQALVAFGETAAVSRLMIDRAFAESEYELDLATAKRKLAATMQSETQIYQVTLANLQNREAVQKTMGAAGVKAAEGTNAQIVELTKSHNLQLSTEALRGNAQIEVMEKEHYARLKREAKKFDDDFQQIIKSAFSAKDGRQGSSFAASMLGTDFHDRFQQAEEDAKALGITLSGTVAANLAKAETAFKNMQTLQKSGTVSALDLAKANLALAKSQLEFDKTQPNAQTAVKATKKAIDDLTKSIQKMEGEVPKVKSGWDTFAADFKKKAKELGTESQTMGKMVADSAFQMQHAFESAMASAILSESSFGEALKKGTAQVLAQLSAQAAVHAVYSLALGFLKEAQWDFVGAHLAFTAAAEFGVLAGAAGAAGHALSGGGSSGGSSGANNGPSITKDSNTTTGTNQQPGLNIPHLESGGLITAPTLAMLGEGNKREAVIPLSDANAMNMLSEIFAKHVGAASGAAGGNTNFYINGMVSSDTVGKMAKKLSRQVQTGRTRLTASNTHKITRRGI